MRMSVCEASATAMGTPPQGGAFCANIRPALAARETQRLQDKRQRDRGKAGRPRMGERDWERGERMLDGNKAKLLTYVRTHTGTPQRPLTPALCQVPIFGALLLLPFP